MLLRKLVVFAITSGLAKKAWDQYMVHRRKKSVARAAPVSAPTRRAPATGTAPTTASTGAVPAGQPVETASTNQYH